jgi:hypothetical protein
MHQRRSRRCSTRSFVCVHFFVGLFLGCTTIGGLADAANAQAPAVPRDAIPALVRLAECVRDNRSVAALVLMDESGSLKKTDPDNQRVTAAKSAIESLANLAEHNIDGEKPQVQVAVGGFSVDYEEVAGWTDLTYGSVDSVKRSVDGLAGKNSGLDTDYAAALIGAKKVLDQKQSVPCRALLWFTDGKYDIDPRKGKTPTKAYAPQIKPFNKPKELIAAGREIICKSGGLVDDLRNDKIGNIAVGLTAQLLPPDQAFLQALTNGKSPTESCGSIDGNTTGAFIPVNNLAELISSFDTVGATLGYGVQGKPELNIAVCSTTACPSGSRTFPVETGMSRVHISAQTGGKDVSISLKTPEQTIETAPQIGAQTTVTKTTIGSTSARIVWLAEDVAKRLQRWFRVAN